MVSGATALLACVITIVLGGTKVIAGWWLLVVFLAAWFILYVPIKAALIKRPHESYGTALMDAITFHVLPGGDGPSDGDGGGASCGGGH